jgi:hypothetical protein
MAVKFKTKYEERSSDFYHKSQIELHQNLTAGLLYFALDRQTAASGSQ